MWSGAVLCVGVYLVCFYISINRIFDIFRVRKWFLFSGWMKGCEQIGNVETNSASLGQIVALVTMVSFLIVGFDKLTWQLSGPA